MHEASSITLARPFLDEMDRVAAVHRASFDERLPWLSGLHTPAEDRTYFREHVFTSCEVWVAATATDREIVGFIAFQNGSIEQLYVMPTHQGRGIGAALLGIAKSAAPRLQLWTFQRNEPARRFYERHGFVAAHETDGSANEEREPDVLYRWNGEPW